MFKVGQKVVCVNDDFSDLMRKHKDFSLGFKQLPVKDQVYTVRSVDNVAIRLEEIVNPVIPINLGDRENPVWINDEPAFHHSRFAPLLEDRDKLTDNLLNDLFKDIENDPDVMPHIMPEIEEEEILYI